MPEPVSRLNAALKGRWRLLALAAAALLGASGVEAQVDEERAVIVSTQALLDAMETLAS
jgi:hypothetical protein